MNSTGSQCDTSNLLEDDLMSRLNSYADSHPNVVTLWKEYIKVKMNFLKQTGPVGSEHCSLKLD